MKFNTDQEKFWAGEFGNGYNDRNQSEQLIASNAIIFKRILESASNIGSIVELGCNIGLNLKALNTINSGFDLCGYEINSIAAQKARELRVANIIEGTILEPLDIVKQYDLSFTKVVLIHINPEELYKVYENLYNLSNRYIMLCEYHNPTPVTVTYRGHSDRLFKRDFAGELLNKYNMKLVDYGFIYHRDNNHLSQDDMNWFLLEKISK